MKKFLTLPVLATVLLTLVIAGGFMLLTKFALAVAAAVLLLGFSGLFVATRYGVPLYASFRTDDNLVKQAMSIGMLDSTGYGYVETLTETHLASSFTDGGSTSGTKQFTAAVPLGAILLGSKTLVNAGFAGDVSAALIIGDGSDTDRYNTSTINVFTTAAAGVESGVPSGNKLLTAANKPTLTVTSSTDFTLVLTGGGSITVSLFYIRTR
jgi:hypothetical protein